MTGTAAAPTSVAAAIIAGGRGRRMAGAEGGSGADPGADAESGAVAGAGGAVALGGVVTAGEVVTKGLLLVDGRRIIDRQLEVLRGRFSPLIIVANQPAPWQEIAREIDGGFDVRVVPDRFAGGAGPLAGLDAALAALPDGVEAVVCLASDMPFLDPAVLELLRDSAPAAVALCPRVGGRPEPLLARYARGCAPVVREQLERGAFAMMALLARLPVTWLAEPALRAVDPQLRSLVNVNTRHELLAAGGRFSAGHGG
jgi:molybdopterin-guanine dinucleotide biosynthesis protein A